MIALPVVIIADSNDAEGFTFLLPKAIFDRTLLITKYIVNYHCYWESNLSKNTLYKII